jgi:ubiquinone/menaquinone biosynthesis C-methylase UbiE
VTKKSDTAPPAEVTRFYASIPEESRLESGHGRLEFARSREMIRRVLPEPPASIIDVGGAAGVYSLWLAELGYEVHLVDASARLVDEARKRSAEATHAIASFSVADARALPQQDGSARVVLVMGPLYHLTSADDRLAALAEACRVLAPGGAVVVAAVSRYASALDGLAERHSLDPRFVAIRDRDLADGQHRNDTGHPQYFTTAYFHRPEDLRVELETSGFQDVRVLGVEGPGWLMQDFDDRWADEAQRKDMIDVARALESEPSIVGVSAHLLGIGRKP